MHEQPTEGVVSVFEELKALKPKSIADSFVECSVCQLNKGVCRGLGQVQIGNIGISDKIGQGGRLVADTLNKSIEWPGIYFFLLFREYWLLPELDNLEGCSQREALQKFVTYRKAIFDALIPKDNFPEET